MNLQELTAKIDAKATTHDPIGLKFKLNLGDDGIIFIDGNNGNKVSNDDADADCTIIISITDFLDLVKGNLNPMAAFMGGKLRVEGDISAAMQLQSLLS
jgi:putative sterol carrier protein